MLRPTSIENSKQTTSGAVKKTSGGFNVPIFPPAFLNCCAIPLALDILIFFISLFPYHLEANICILHMRI